MQEKFFTEPPYNYRPSNVEYLTKLKITENGLLADILYLDKNKKINITSYDDKKVKIDILKEYDLSYSEDFLINVIRHEKDSNNYFEISRLKKHARAYEDIIINEMENKFSFDKKISNVKRKKDYIILGFISNFLLSLTGSFATIFLMPIMMIFLILLGGIGIIFNFISGLFMPYLIILFISKKKLKKSPNEYKFLYKEIFVDLLKLYIISIFGYLSLALIFLAFFFLPLILVPIFFSLYFYYKYGKLAKKFLLWYKESEVTQKHRTDWLAFKDFVITYSEVETRPLKYYETWEEFYYYTLACGAIKPKK